MGREGKKSLLSSIQLCFFVGEKEDEKEVKNSSPVPLLLQPLLPLSPPDGLEERNLLKWDFLLAFTFLLFTEMHFASYQVPSPPPPPP